MSFLILLLGRIGDMVLLTPFIKILSENFPDAKIDILASRHNWVILKDNPRISQIYIYNKEPWKVPTLFIKLLSRKYSYYIDPKDHYSTESQIFSKIVRAEKKIYFSKDSKSNILPLQRIDNNSGLHFSQKLMQPLKYLGIEFPEKPIRPELFEDNNSHTFISNFYQNLSPNKMNILLNISASKENKMWGLEKWIEFLSLININDFNIIISADPKERDKLIALNNKFLNTIITPARNFFDLISLIKNVDLVITPDTSIVHIASAFNKPILGLFSGLRWNRTLFEPLCDIKSIVTAADGIDDIRQIPVEEVKNSFDKLIDILQDGQYSST